MTQLDADQYVRLTKEEHTYGRSDGLYWDKTNSLLVLVINDAVVFSIDSSGTVLAGAIEAPDLEVSGETRGDLLYRAASAWARLAVGTTGQILNTNGTDPSWASISGDATMASGGALTVTDVTVGSDAAGDLLYKSSATALARLAKGTAGQFLQMNTGATAPEWDTVKEVWPFRIPAASGIDTDGYNGALAGCDQALDVTRTDPGATYCQVFDASAAGYAALETASAGDFVQWQLLPNNTQDADFVYFGGATKYCQLHFDMSATVQTYTGDGLAWTYYNGSTWAALTVRDYTDATAQDGKRSFGRDGSLSFTPPSDWATTAVNSVTAYWIRASPTAANISAIGITNSVRHKLCSPTDGFIVPHACTVTSIAIRDEAGTPHSGADVKFLLMNFTTGANTGELTFPQDKRNDVFASLTLSCAASDVLGVLIRQEDGTNEIGPVTLELSVTLV